MAILPESYDDFESSKTFNLYTGLLSDQENVKKRSESLSPCTLFDSFSFEHRPWMTLYLLLLYS